jgi:hypothetical protein
LNISRGAFHLSSRADSRVGVPTSRSSGFISDLGILGRSVQFAKLSSGLVHPIRVQCHIQKSDRHILIVTRQVP